MIPRSLRLVLLLLLAAALGACTSGFDSKWRAAGQRPPADRCAGRWAGEWRSTRGTHHGALECVFTKQTPAKYTADFHAHFHGLSGTYSVPFATTLAHDGLHFRGRQDLGPIQGGMYQYCGVVTATKFSAQYDSRFDTGVFELKRLAGGH